MARWKKRFSSNYEWLLIFWMSVGVVKIGQGRDSSTSLIPSPRLIFRRGHHRCELLNHVIQWRSIKNFFNPHSPPFIFPFKFSPATTRAKGTRKVALHGKVIGCGRERNGEKFFNLPRVMGHHLTCARETKKKSTWINHTCFAVHCVARSTCRRWTRR